jgi:hypothetical protein
MLIPAKLTENASTKTLPRFAGYAREIAVLALGSRKQANSNPDGSRCRLAISAVKPLTSK